MLSREGGKASPAHGNASTGGEACGAAVTGSVIALVDYHLDDDVERDAIASEPAADVASPVTMPAAPALPEPLATEWRERGAVLLASGAIVTKLGANTPDFRQRVYAALEAGGGA